MSHLRFVFLLLIFSQTVHEPEVTQEYRVVRVCDDIKAGIKNKEVACEIEKAFREEGFEDSLIKAALLNSYAESGFNPRAVGDHGDSKGIFQLNKNGLGMKMSDKQKYDVRSSVRRVAVEIRKSRKLVKAIKNGSKFGELTRLFCTEIMRPSHKHKTARTRERLAKELFRKPTAHDTGVKDS